MPVGDKAFGINLFARHCSVKRRRFGPEALAER
jgi:hypothetical protein